jgi:hypothetical protein
VITGAEKIKPLKGPSFWRFKKQKTSFALGDNLYQQRMKFKGRKGGVYSNGRFHKDSSSKKDKRARQDTELLDTTVHESQGYSDPDLNNPSNTQVLLKNTQKFDANIFTDLREDLLLSSVRNTSLNKLNSGKDPLTGLPQLLSNIKKL